MKVQRQEMLDLLQYNKGFAHPEKWIQYGINCNFKKTQAEKLLECPDCGASFSKLFGQYVYYSTLIKLKVCTFCGLIFSDTRLDFEVIQSHFEENYKNESYFYSQRRRIFEQISNLVDRVAPIEGKILDIGGAKGHLLSILRVQRPDLDFWLNDLSKVACDYAASEYGFKTVPGGISELGKLSTRFDVVIMSDVIYYEPELRKLWMLLPKLVSENGSVIIRVPNRLAIISFRQFMFKMFSSAEKKMFQDRVRFFNPEHLYILPGHYLQKRLRGLGFSQVAIMPSELLNVSPSNIRRSLYYCLCKMLWQFSAGSLVTTPSLLVIAQNKSSIADEVKVANEKTPDRCELVEA